MQDILLNTNREVQIANGDFVVAEADLQDVDLLLQVQPGSIRQWPTVGLGLVKDVNAEYGPLEQINLNKRIRQMLALDGKEPTKVDVTKDPMQIEIA